MGRTGCCQQCATIYRVDADGKIVWKNDFFADAQTGLIAVAQCDVDADGNVYQAATRLNNLVPVNYLEQSNPMYTLRSWDSDGNLRWSWSECPYGVEGGDGLRRGPTPLLGCRTSNNNGSPIVIVGDNSALNAFSGDTHDTQYSDGLTRATALDQDGNQVWRVTLIGGATLVAASENRSLWYRWQTPIDFSSPIILLDNADGSEVLIDSGNHTFTSYDYPNVVPHATNIICATIDDDDTVYAVCTKRLGYSPVINFGVARLKRDSLTIEKIVTSENLFYDAQFTFNPSCLSRTGVPWVIRVQGDSLIVAGSTGFEVFNKASLESTDYSCIRMAGGNGFYSGGFFFADDEKIGMQTTLFNIFVPPAILNRSDFSQWKVWDQTSTDYYEYYPHPSQNQTFRDARSLPGGGSIWSQDRTCVTQELVDDTRALSRDCVPLCCDTCFAVEGAPTTIDCPTITNDDMLNILIRLNSLLGIGAGFQPPLVEGGIIDPGGPLSFVLPDPISFELPDGLYDLTLKQGVCQSSGCIWQSATNFSIDLLLRGNSSLVLDTDGIGATLYINSGQTKSLLDWSDQMSPSYLIGQPRIYYAFGLNGAYRCDDFSCEEAVFNFQSGVFWGQVAENVDTDPTGPGYFYLSNQVYGDWPLPRTLTVVPADCGGTIDSHSECLGTQDWISTGNEAEGYQWSMFGPDNCTKGCVRQPPVTDPSSSGLFTTTNCL